MHRIGPTRGVSGRSVLSFLFYANNFVLLYTAWMVLHAGDFVQFLTWSTGLIGALALYAAIEIATARARARKGRRDRASRVVALISRRFFSIIRCSATSTCRSARWRCSQSWPCSSGCASRPEWLFVSAAIAGFLVGMKASFSCWFRSSVSRWRGGGSRSARAARDRRRPRGALHRLRAVVRPQSGARRRSDCADDQHRALRPRRTLENDRVGRPVERHDDVEVSAGVRPLPVRAYLRPSAPDFREYGASALVLFLYVPADRADRGTMRYGESRRPTSPCRSSC